ncbi:MAG: hypothetical protein EBS34_12600 [Flavobacteriales bacterium]|nr:hypothetical protein [Flavobacteriales bacterium]
MKKLFFLPLFLLSINAYCQEELVFKANTRLVQPAQLEPDNKYNPKDRVEISFVMPKNIDPKGSKKYQWTINGATSPGKGWVLEKGTNLNSEKIKVYFEKVGNYSVGLTFTVTVKTKVGDEIEEDETEYSGEKEDFISVRSVFPELAALYAEKPNPNYVKLVEKASEYSVKPKYANDPTPHLFLAKGYLGLVKTTNTDPRFESALEECISSFNTARELDKNGVIFDNEHQRFLVELENYLFDENIVNNVDADPKTDPDGFDIVVENVDNYNQISFAPITSVFLQAAYKFMKKDVKGANQIWADAIPILKKYVQTDGETAYGKKFKDEAGNEIIISNIDLKILKFGVMKSAVLLKARDGNASLACELINIVKPWLTKERDFLPFVKGQFNNCKE